MTRKKKTGKSIKLRGKSFRKRKEGQVRLHCCCAMCNSGWTEFLSRKNNDDEHAKERRQQTVATKYCEKKSVRKRKEVGSDVSLLFGWRELLFWKIAVNRRPWWDTHDTGVNWWQLKIYLFWNLFLIPGLCCRHRSFGMPENWLTETNPKGRNLKARIYSTIHFIFCSQGKF